MKLPSLQRRAAVMAAFLVIAGLVTLSARMAARASRPYAGLVQQIFANPDLDGPPVLERRSTEIDVGVILEDPQLPHRQMSVRWNGFWLVQSDGPIQVSVNADDEIRVWLDEALVADRHVVSGYRTHVDPVMLQPGAHHLRVEFVQHGGGMALDARWAPAGEPFRPLAGDSFFASRPDAAVIAAVRWARTLRMAERTAWVAVLAAVAMFFVLPAMARPDGVTASGDRRSDGDWSSWRAGQRRWSAGLAVGASILAVGSAVSLRLGAINPVTLWADDVWVAALVSLPSLLDAITTPAPIPPAFVVLQWLMRQVADAPAAPLQMLPLLFGVGVAVGLGTVVARVSGSLALGVAALVLGLLDPFMAQVSVFVKQYTLDGLVAVAWLWLSVEHASGRARSLGWIVVLALASLLLSFPSAFLSVSLVHIVAFTAIRESGRSSRQAAWRVVRLLGAFYAGALAVYWVVLRPRAAPSLQWGWRREFVPMSDLAAAFEFLQTRSVSIAEHALPTALVVTAPLAAVGLVWLMVRREWRPTAWFIVGACATLLAAASLGFYPIGTNYEGRVVLFLHPLFLFLIAVGGRALWRWSRLDAALNMAAAGAALWFLLGSAGPVAYLDHDHSHFAAELAGRADDTDGVVLNHRASYLVAVYTGWPRTGIASPNMEGFHVRFDRPLTVTLPPPLESEAAESVELDALLTVNRPARLFFFSLRRETDVYETRITNAGYHPVERKTSSTSMVFTVFERQHSPAGPGPD